MVLITIWTSLPGDQSNLDTVQSGLSSIGRNGRHSAKIQKIPSLILHQINILENNQFLKNCHPNVVTIPLPFATIILRDLWVPSVGNHRSLSDKTVLSALYIVLCLLFLVWLIYGLCPSWAAPASLKPTPVALAECSFNEKATPKFTGWPKIHSNSSPTSYQISIKKEAHYKKGNLYLHYLIRHVLKKTWPTVSLPTCKHYN